MDIAQLAGVGSIGDLISTYALFGLAVLLAGLLAGTVVSRRLNAIVTRLALVLFGTHRGPIDRRRSEYTRRLRAARFPTTYRMYAAKTLFYVFAGALIGGLIGIYLVWWGLRILALDPATLRDTLPEGLSVLADFAGIETLAPLELLPLFVVSALTIGAVVGGVLYWLRWWYPSSLAEARGKRIDATLPQIVAFVYALARSGMAFPQVMRIVAAHSRIYGAAAEEFDVAVRHMDVFGRDMVTAIRLTSQRSPSDTFQEFSQNLASVLQSGRNLESFLESQYDEFREEAEAQQRQLLTLLSTLAEAYVTLFVAGPLFLITILVVIGLTGAETLTPLRLFVYLILPAANLAFIAYLDSAMGGFGIGRRMTYDEDRGTDRERAWLRDLPQAEPRRADGGQFAKTETQRRLTVYKQIRQVRRRLQDPIGTIRQRPEVVLYVTVPVLGLLAGGRLIVAETLTLDLVETVLLQTALGIVGTFALAYEYHHRRIRRIEDAVPDFLDRLASVNQAGMTVIESIGRVRESNLGALNMEIDRLWADLQWGADIETGFKRLEQRVRTATVSRVVALITNAMNASGNIARVLRIAANQAKADQTLKRERRQEMLTYTIVVYISFAVFLIIIAALDTVLLPNLPETGIAPEGPAGAQLPTGGLSGFGDVDVGAFQTVFQHTAYLQALVTGFVAGQMSRGDVRAGALHATILLLVAYLTFLVL